MAWQWRKHNMHVLSLHVNYVLKISMFCLQSIPLQEGWYFYYAVEDNGEGANADPDRYHPYVYWGQPGMGSFCNVLAPNSPFWPEALWQDVADLEDQIQVK